MTKMFSKIKNFLMEVKSEMKKVSWPTRKETLKYTLAVIGVSVVLAAFFGGLDYTLTYLLETYILK